MVFVVPRYLPIRGSTNGYFLANRGSVPKVSESSVTSQIKPVIPQEVATGGGDCGCDSKPTIHISKTNITPSVDQIKQHSMEEILGRLKGKGKKKYGGSIVKA